MTEAITNGRDRIKARKWQQEYYYNGLGKESIARYRLRLRMEVLKVLGDKCVRCGFSDWQCLQIDHIKGGGEKERKRLRNNLTLYRNIIKNQEGYQLLCANCNQKKRYENQEGVN
jgi:hypothetical protein